MGNTPAKAAEPEVFNSDNEGGESSVSSLSSSVPEFRAHLISSSAVIPVTGRGSAVAGEDDDAVTVLASVHERKTVPTVIRWENGGRDVMVAGTFSRWEKIPMSER